MNLPILSRQLAILVLMLSSAAGAEQRKLDLSAMEFLGIRSGGAQTLDDVARRLGKTHTWHTGDASESESKLCYRVSSEQGETIIVFASSGEMAHPPGQVNSIRLIAPELKFPNRKNCSPVKLSASELKAKNGLRLGMSSAEVQGLFWQKNPAKNGSLHYTSCQKRYLHKADPHFKDWVGQAQCFEDPNRPYVSDCGYVQVEFKQGRAVFVGLNMNQSVC